MVSSLAALVTAVGAIVSLWIQNGHVRVTRSLDILLRMEAKFDSERMKDLRRKAAKGFLEGKLVDEAYYVLDFFEEAGLLLNKNAIHEDILFESFYHSILAYWFTAKGHIVELRHENKELYDHFELLVKRDLAYAKKKTREETTKLEDESYWKYFMERETRAS
jgi:uncharacterized protein DUF4760